MRFSASFLVAVLSCHLLRYPFSFDLLHLSVAFGVVGFTVGAFFGVGGRWSVLVSRGVDSPVGKAEDIACINYTTLCSALAIQHYTL